jgi:hypothetical protein
MKMMMLMMAKSSDLSAMMALSRHHYSYPATSSTPH